MAGGAIADSEPPTLRTHRCRALPLILGEKRLALIEPGQHRLLEEPRLFEWQVVAGVASCHVAGMVEVVERFKEPDVAVSTHSQVALGRCGHGRLKMSWVPTRRQRTWG